MNKLISTAFFIFLCSLSAFAQSNAKTDDSAKRETKPNALLKILYKPRAAPPQTADGGMVCMQGIVTLRVQFLASGEIGDIRLVSGLPYNANENAFAAARKMKFEPARKNGEPLTVTKAIQFSFSIY